MGRTVFRLRELFEQRSKRFSCEYLVVPPEPWARRMRLSRFRSFILPGLCMMPLLLLSAGHKHRMARLYAPDHTLLGRGAEFYVRRPVGWASQRLECSGEGREKRD